MLNHPSKTEIAIFGIGQMSDIVSFYFRGIGRKIKAYIVDDSSISACSFLGRPVFQIEEFCKNSPRNNIEVFVAISYHENNDLRERYFKFFSKLGYQFSSYVSAKSYLASDVEIGGNCLILEGVNIQKTCILRDNSFVWTAAQIGHHSIVGENVFLGSGSVLMGCNKVGNNAHISANATVKDHVNIEPRVFIPPGTVILE